MVDTAPPEPPAPTAGPGERGRRRPLLGRTRWAVLVLALAGVQLGLLARRFYYGNDDLLQFEVAQEAGLSWELLSLNVFQHFAPYNRLAHLAVVSTGVSPAAGMAFMLLNYVALLLGLLWLLAELGLSARRRLFALIAVGLSISVSESAIWFDTSMHILPAIAITLAVCAAHVRGVRTGAARWHVLALLLFAAGQLIQERPIFALPLAVLVDVLLLWRDLPWRERLRRLWAVRLPLAALAVVAALIAVALQMWVVWDGPATPDWATTGRTMLLALTQYFVPSLVNLRLADPLPTADQVMVLVTLVVVGVVLSRLRRGNAGPVLFATAAFVLYYGFLKFGFLLNASSIVENAERLHYAVYVAVPTIIALAHLRLPARRPRLPAAWSRRLTAVTAVALAAYLAVAGNAYLDQRWADTTGARAYLDAVRAGADQWSDPDVTLIPLWADPAMATSWSAPYARHDRLLDLVVPGFEPGDLGPEPVLIDDTGTVRTAALVDVRGEVTVQRGACGPAGPRPGARVDVRAELARTRGPSFVVVRYEAEEDVAVEVVTDSDRGVQESYFRTEVPAGERTRVIAIDDPDIRDLALTTGTAGGMCVEDLRVVRAVLVEDDGRSCRTVDRLGHPGARAPCR